MSAEILRRAAALMRERAEAATPGPWRADVLGSEGYAVTGPQGTRRNGHRLAVPRVARCGYEDWDTDRDNASHLASWHPTVALAVAVWLDRMALSAGLHEDGLHITRTEDSCCADLLYLPEALAVARAYLGSDSCGLEFGDGYTCDLPGGHS